jgi:hypothetical protein
LCLAIARLGDAAEPEQRQIGIAIDIVGVARLRVATAIGAAEIHPAQLLHGPQRTGIGGALQPLHRTARIDFRAAAIFQSPAEFDHRRDETAFGRLREPLSSLDEIARHAFAVAVMKPEIVHRERMALLGGAL